MSAGAETSSFQPRNSRLVYRNGWLRSLSSVTEDKKPSTLPEKSWVVFCVIELLEPVLELYADRAMVGKQTAATRYSLKDTLHVSAEICPSIGNEHVFAIITTERTIRLSCSSWNTMMNWVNGLSSKLIELGIMAPKENPYSHPPEAKPALLPTRDPNSPLPAPPAEPVLIPGIELIESEPDTEAITTNTTQHQPTNNQSMVNQPTTIQPTTIQPTNQSRNVTVIRVNDRDMDSADERPIAMPRERAPLPPPLPIVPSSSASETSTSEANAGVSLTGSDSRSSRQRQNVKIRPTASNSSSAGNENDNDRNAANTRDSQVPVSSLYERVIVPPVAPSIEATSSECSQSNQPGQISLFALGNHLPKIGRGSHRDGKRKLLSGSQPIAADRIRSTRQLPSSNSPPMSCLINGMDVSPSRRLTLREHQVMQLRREISHPGGVRLQLRRKDCVDSLALVDAFQTVWVAGWKQKEHPTLYHAFHIGDQLISLNGKLIRNSADAQKMLKSCAYNLNVEFVIRRVPRGRVLAARRESESQIWGIIQEGNTAEVKDVLPNSPVASKGLSPKTQTMDGLALTTWYLTEINGRPLNLFFKNNEVRDRLNAIGLDISLLAQPSDLIKQLKRQLKTNRNYKDYIVQ